MSILYPQTHLHHTIHSTRDTSTPSLGLFSAVSSRFASLDVDPSGASLLTRTVAVQSIFSA